MSKDNLKQFIEKFWEEKESINSSNKDLIKVINEVLSLLDNGNVRICEKN